MLFSLRPDLANPSPANLPSLAARASNSTSIGRVLANFNAQTLQALETLLILDSLGRPLNTSAVIHAILGSPHDRLHAQGVTGGVSYEEASRIVTEQVSLLNASALIWYEENENAPAADTVIRLAPGLESTLPRFAAGFGPLSANAVATSTLPHSAPALCTKVLETLLWGPPVAVVARNLLSINPPADEPATNESLRWLLRNGYLELLDETHVYLPRQTAFALRGERTHKGLTVPPLADTQAVLTPASVQSEGARAASEVVRLVNELIGLWESEPAQALRNGGLPVRELKRLSNELDVPPEDAILIVELAFAARLVRSSDEASRDFAPTVAADAWRDMDLPHRWSHIVQGWLASSRTPWRVGAPDSRGTALNALHPELHDHWVPRLRATVLGVLKEYPLTPITADALVQQLTWFAPNAQHHPDAVAALLREATFLGVVADGTLLPGAQDGSLARALEFALPDAVSEIFIQGDLTGMVPGRPSTPLETLLESCAIVESRGGALTVRFTTDSITRAFDLGMGAVALTEDLAAFSVTPLPQPLTYLIADVARRHGQIRVGAVSSYIKFADEAAARSVLSLVSAPSVGLFEIVPTVLGAQAAIGQVLAILREAGFAPAIEGPDGQVISADRQSKQVRVPPRHSRSNFESHAGISAPLGGDSALHELHATGTHSGLPASAPASSLLAKVVAEIRSASDTNTPLHGDHHSSPHEIARPRQVAASASGNVSARSAVNRSAPRSTRVSPPSPAEAAPADETGVIVVNLREAISQGALVSVALADGTGKLTHRTLKPLLLESGRLRAHDPARESELTIAIHRIASVTFP